MRVLLMSLGILFSLSLTGCPTPPEEAAGPQGGPQGGPPGAGAGGPPPGAPPAGAPGEQGNPGEAPPTDGSVAPAPTAVPPNGGAPGAMGAPPSFSTLLGAGDPTITITVKIEGATAGQVDFQTIDTSGDNPAPHALHVEKFGEDGIAKATAPATYPEPIYIVADSYSNGTSLSPGDPVGAYAEPITLSGEDLELTIHIGDSAEWLSKGGGPPPGSTPGQAPGGALTPPATPPQEPTAPAPTDAGGQAPE